MRHQAISVWPGYVAAVASLVMSLLLLAAIMVFAITRVGQVVGDYNDELMVAVIEDELRAIEIEDIRQRSNQVQIDLSQRNPINPPPPPVVELPRQSALDAEIQNLRTLQDQVRQREAALAQTNQELSRLQGELRVLIALQEDDKTKTYRFIFEQGVQGLNERVINQFLQQVQADGVLLRRQSWVMEAGVMGLDPVARREVYRLMISARKQLESSGFNVESIRMVLNNALTPQALLSAPGSINPGDVPVLLSARSIPGEI
jgi:hypothetical protein